MDELERLARRLFQTCIVTRNPTPGEVPRVLTPGRPGWLLFEGESLTALRELEDHLANSALSKGGPSRVSAMSAAITATDVANVEGINDALDSLRAFREQQLRTWTVFDPIRVHLGTGRDLIRVGGCTISGDLDTLNKAQPESVPLHWLDDLKNSFPAQVIHTQVEAFDEQSARVLADDRFAEARAILVLADGHYRAGTEETFLVAADGGVVIESSGKKEFFDMSRLVTQDGEIGGDFDAISRAVAKPEGERNDWERRSVAAVRWYAEALGSTWPALALVACMTALECLYVKGVGAKGSAIAEEVTERWLLPGIERAAQRTWLNDLYKNRNKAIHEGFRFVEERDLERLLPLTESAVRRALWHLDESHRIVGEGGRCQTYEQAIEHDRQLV